MITRFESEGLAQYFLSTEGGGGGFAPIATCWIRHCNCAFKFEAQKYIATGYCITTVDLCSHICVQNSSFLLWNYTQAVKYWYHSKGQARTREGGFQQIPPNLIGSFKKFFCSMAATS